MINRYILYYYRALPFVCSTFIACMFARSSSPLAKELNLIYNTLVYLLNFVLALIVLCIHSSNLEVLDFSLGYMFENLDKSYTNPSWFTNCLTRFSYVFGQCLFYYIVHFWQRDESKNISKKVVWRGKMPLQHRSMNHNCHLASLQMVEESVGIDARESIKEAAVEL